MPYISQSALVALGLVLVPFATLSEPPKLAATPSRSAETSSLTTPLSQLSFLAGSWKGVKGKDVVEEIWSAPEGTSMMGCFRWITPDGTPAMFEMLAITKEKDATRLRLRHYTPTLGAKEDADKPLTLILTESAPSRAVFTAEKGAGSLARITYEVTGSGLGIVVEFAPPADPKDAPREPLRFSLQR